MWLHPPRAPSILRELDTIRHQQQRKKKKRWLLVAMTTGRQRLHGTKDGRSRLCDWERESKWCVAEQARPSWGPYSFVSCWDHRSPDAAEIEEEEGGVVVGGKERGEWEGANERGNWCGKRELKWCLERWRVKQRISNKCTEGAEIFFFSVVICSHSSVKCCLLKQSPWSWHSVLLKLDFTVPILAN